MRHSRAAAIVCFLCLCLGLAGNAGAQETGFQAVPDVLRPGKMYSVEVNAPYTGGASLYLTDDSGALLYSIYTGYPVYEGHNSLGWDGMTAEENAVAEGEYTLVFEMEDGTRLSAPLRIGAPYPLITHVLQNEWVLTGTEPLTISFEASVDGTLEVQLRADGTQETTLLPPAALSAGENVYQWNGLLDGELAPAGEYTLLLLLQGENGQESMEHNVFITVADPTQNATDAPVDMVDITPTPAPTATPAPTSAPYSSVDDGTFWSMHPGELDDEVIWDILTQPIVVYDDGREAGTFEHAYLMENPDGSGERVAQLHVQSQGVHVIGEENEYGYVLVEAFSNYDLDYNVYTQEEREHAFDLRQGYVQAKYLKTVEVNQHQGLLIDKLTQRMYLFLDGERVTEFLISTGKITSDEKYHYETIAGEYITISRTGAFGDEDMYCDMAIRINGGILIHEVPCMIAPDGYYDYDPYEPYLGTKASHACVRVQRELTPEGYNHEWLWDNLELNTKVLIWDDANRLDTPTTWQPNP